MAGRFIVSATARPGASLSQVEQTVTDEIARLAKDGPTLGELNRAKTKWEFQYITGLERIGGFGGKADLLNTYNTFLGDPDKFATDVQRHRAVTAEGLRQIAAQWLDTRNRVLVRFHPETSSAETAAAIDRSKQPELGADRPFQAPQVKSAQLENGLQVLVVERRDLFAPEEVDREKKKRLAMLAQAENEPNSISARVALMLAFGRSHPYGHPATGFPSTVEKLTSEDLSRFHDTYWKPGGSALILVGDISLAEATDLAKRNFGSWSGGAPPAVTIPPPQPVGPGKVFMVNRSDAAQTVVAEILPGPARSAPDYYELTLADAVWGGAAGARLGTNLREQKGYSYGVFSFPRAYSKYRLWRASGGVQTNKTKESLVEFAKELKYIAGEKPVSEKELTDAKHERVRGYAQQFEAMGRVADQIISLWVGAAPHRAATRAR
jgi:predicted Zn-dependent peptidase